MCGIAGFLSNQAWKMEPDLGWLAHVDTGLTRADAADPAGLAAAIDALAARFDDLMAFSTHMAAIANPAVRNRLENMAARAKALEAELAAGPNAREPQVERLAERLRDYGWQLATEVLGNIDRTAALLPDAPSANRAQHMIAWGIGQVIENLERLEVRGRDSAGIAVQMVLEPPLDLRALRGELAAEGIAFGDMDGGIALHALPDGRATARFTFKVAQLIGRLGDNGAAIRAKVTAHAALWRLAAKAGGMSAIAHTRWASHGAINLPNCHPLNGRLDGEDAAALNGDADAVGALNGDVDNYRALREALVEAAGHRIPAEITTDAKIIPVLFRLQGGNAPRADRVMAMLRQMEGSMAIVIQHPEDPERLYLGQKGSGQSLFVAEVRDGVIIASENYGLAPRARASIALSQVQQGGLQVTLSTAGGEPGVTARTAEDGVTAALKADPIEIFSRDIFRGGFDHFFEKEVHEAAASVRKTLTGRYRRVGREASFQMEGGPWALLRGRLNSPDRPPVRRIWVTGQGTAAIAAMGVAHLLRVALAGAAIHVESEKASELSANLEGRNLDDALVIAISQSGTTTDTNRTVDLARAAGAWIHGIVNRRNSDLVRKSDSHLFTSDGRDIEMAVASTKAFYSQVTAGKLTALCLADALGTMSKSDITSDLLALEALPARIQEVLDDEAAIAEVAEKYAPYNRYWACVGNGANRIAAEEIRIKLSELCYKSIPVDYTEDKKHIDLSTEPLTIVIANDLPALLAQDTAKEVAIFKAHAGKPIVIAAKGESCFDAYAEAVIRVPSAGAGLDFVLATVAGHLWGFHAARAIDKGSIPFRELRSLVDERSARAGTGKGAVPCDDIAGRIGGELERIARGELDAALPPRLAAKLALLTPRLAAAGGMPASAVAGLLTETETVLRDCFEETSRPIDTIRHQAKTVTVGISRPAREISPALQAALADLGVALTGLAEHDRQMLTALSPVLTGIAGGLFYEVVETGAEGEHTLRTVRAAGISADRPTSYDTPRVVTGTKRRALRLGRGMLAAGRSGQENLILLPVFDPGEWEINGLVLLHARVAPQTSLQQKTALLKELRLYEDLFDAFHEAGLNGGAVDFATFMDRASPRDLLFRTVTDLLRG
ncbi:SIS domain-containing protein [Indioceanicola profundi]|uniref:SIS domain-containing protein n=1 Tax=Indioceanicola profundi TaxID=2220096 RepID=UPI000E6ABF81|nr:SIS domain-containing protein [Indioceanicola profundi]